MSATPWQARSRTLLAALLLVLSLPLLTGCERDPVDPDATAGFVDVGSLDNFGDGPATPGPVIFRLEDGMAAVWTDPKNGLTAVVGFDPLEICNGFGEFDTADYQDKFPPGDPTRWMTNYQANDVRGSVWTGRGCAHYLANEPVVAGEVSVRGNDNDILIFTDPENTNSNSYGLRANGVFKGHFHCVWDGEDLAAEKCQFKVVLP